MKNSPDWVRITIFASIVAAVVGIGLMIWSQTPRHSSIDQTYLDGLSDAGVEGVDDKVLLDQARRICIDLENGVYPFSVASRLSKTNPNQTIDEALLQVGGAVGSYCLDQRGKLDGW
ncbi:DUF732 domain-containing protein [Mycobacterium sp. DL440]|uniref:DUF732 domain-containing protein n=1 Tax=Mycobacterium sp. DL440 TaxID=2675523 RepID=UPI0014227080|nr:DUF732 domain-containing protein [Mycobacterium sp. DL440]